MKRHFLLLGLLACLLPGRALALPPHLTGIAPAVANPGTTVTVSGGPFEKGVRVLFGEQQLAPASVTNRQLTFVVPPLPEGDYLLLLQVGQETSERGLFFRIVLPPPEILALSPAQVAACAAGEQRQVEVQGRHLRPGVQLLVDGVALAARRSGDQLTFTVPDLAPGLHQIQLGLPDGRQSRPAALLIDSTPTIASVTQGEEYVNYYQLIISGQNFFYHSTLVVDGRPIPSSYPGTVQADNVTYVDCHTLLYQRYPYSKQPKTLSLQVIDRDGKESPVFSLTAP